MRTRMQNPSVPTAARGFPRRGADPGRPGGRCHAAGGQRRRDLPAMVEQCRDPETIRWTTVPTPPDGYQLRDAEEFSGADCRRLGQRRAARLDDRGASGTANAASAAASTCGWKATGSPRSASACIPAARGRSIMSAAVAAGLRLRLRRRWAAGHPLAGGGRQLGRRGGWRPRPASSSTARSGGCWCIVASCWTAGWPP